MLVKLAALCALAAIDAAYAPFTPLPQQFHAKERVLVNAQPKVPV